MVEWTSLRLANPWFLLLGLLIPLAWLVRRAGAPALVFSDVRLLDVQAPASPRLRLIWLPEALRAVWLLLIVVALARPQSPDGATAIVREGISIVFLVDVSGSMATREASGTAGPLTRLDQVKAFVRDFLADSNGSMRRPNDLVGLIAFSKRPTVICPLTHAHETVLELLDGLEVDREENRTNLGDAIALAVDRLASESTDDKVIIVCSDGAHNVEEAMNPGEAARIAAALGMRIQCIGVGDLKREGLPGAGQDEATLRRIAEATGGQLFRADTSESLAAAAAALKELEPRRHAIEGYRAWRELYPEILAIALAVWLVEALLRATWLRVSP